MLKKIRNVLMFMTGSGLLGSTYIIYFDEYSPKHEDYWKQQLGDWYDVFPYIALPVGAILMLFALISSLIILFGNQRTAGD